MANVQLSISNIQYPISNGSKFVCIIAGPTGVGKTAAALELARRWQSEIISADSMQVFSRLRVGTAQPTPTETGGIPYHLIDFLEPVGPEGAEQRFSAAQFIARATPLLQTLFERGRAPVIAGGTGLYLQALTLGLFEHPPIPAAVREAVLRAVNAAPPGEAHRRLERADPETAARIHPNDLIRVARALEIFEATGKTPAQWREEQRQAGAQTDFDWAYFVLNAPRRRLYERINARVERMIAGGLIAETRALLDRGYSPDLHCMKALGYSAVAEYLGGRLDRAAMIQGVQQSHRNYAKRQLTWFRKVKGARWISVEGLDAAAVAGKIEQELAQTSPGAR
ncbi:MAG: tRNA (adenosine(37)-N6)-dimethylallyltransferase MiaA [Candidatus Sumerlaeota bacterium]|nr:tRNA (adenosine(37)-N6)-dimethylallyltransferase MiaA [Candidatus Sumerlaeota bacterium]